QPGRTLRAMQQRREGGIAPDGWRLAPLPAEATHLAVAMARREGRDEVGCMVVARGDAERARRDLATAAEVPGIIGFSVDSVLFREDIDARHAGLSTWDGLVGLVAVDYRGWVEPVENCSRDAVW